MPTINITLWIGGTATNARMALEGAELEGWRQAPLGAGAPWTHFLVYELSRGEQYRLDFSATEPPHSTFAYAVVRPDGTVLSARGYNLPDPQLPAGVFFTP